MLWFRNSSITMLSLLVLAVLIPIFLLAGKSVMCLDKNGSVSMEFSFNGDCQPGSASDTVRAGETAAAVQYLRSDGQSDDRCLDIEMDVTVIMPMKRLKLTARFADCSEPASTIVREDSPAVHIHSPQDRLIRTWTDPAPSLSVQRTTILQI